MAPILRSSARNTPNSKSARTTPSETPDGTPTRKVPHCTKCNRPRAGHPRQGCPYLQGSPTSNTDPVSLDVDLNPQHISDALQSLQIESPTRDAEALTREARRLRRASAQVTINPSDTVASFSTTSSEIIAQLSHPRKSNETDPEVEVDQKQKVVRWQETLVDTPTKAKVKSKQFSRSPMPGTLNTPTPDSSFASTHTLQGKHSSFRQEGSTSTMLPNNDSHGRVTSLTRSMSVEERDAFMKNLSQASKATAYLLSKADIPAVQQSATKLGYFSKAADTKQGETYLVLGRNEQAVEQLYLSIQDDLKTKNSGGGGALRAAAGGAVVGAVATFTGLAFS